MRLPENCSPTVVGEVLNYLKPKSPKPLTAVSSKRSSIFTSSKASHGGDQTLIQAMSNCRDLALQYSLVGNVQIVSECKGFEDTKNWQFHDSIPDAKASFSKSSQAAAVA